MEYKHIPVMLKEAIEYFNPKKGENYIDCTLGGGGYTLEIARRVGEEGRVLAIDMDKLAINNAKQIINKTRLPSPGTGGQVKIKNIILSYGNFKNLQKIVDEKDEGKQSKWDGIVFDLGLSSAQLEDKSRGFSFQLDAPLDMAFGDREEKENNTEYIVNNYKEEELEEIFKMYGEERFSRQIAQKIIERRKTKEIKTTRELVKIIESAVPGYYKKRKLHFATRTFQALRIATNQELENITKALPQALSLLKSGGRIIVISYHSLEDRIVKNFFKKENKECLCPPDFPECRCGHEKKLNIITKKVLIPTDSEIKINPRARSAKMRIAEKI